MEWLNTIARTGTIPVVSEYLVSGATFKAPQPLRADDEMDIDLNIKVKPVDKGKGKAREENFEQSETLGESFARSSNGIFHISVKNLSS